MYRMASGMRWFPGGLILAALLLSAPTGFGAENRNKKQDEQEASNNDKQQQTAVQGSVEEVEFFDAHENGKIDVRVVAGSYAMMAMRVRNVTRTPLKIKLPKTFAAVPVARMQAQKIMQNQGYNGNLGDSYGQNNGGSQGLGGSLGGPWWGNSLAQGSRNQQAGQEQHENSRDQSQYLMIAPGRFVQAQIPSFCLEFGKPDPNSRIPYVICRLRDLNDNKAVEELIERFAKQGINQYVAQLAAWHIGNNVPWPVLAKVQFPRSRTSRGHRVTQRELLAAKQLAESMPSYAKRDSLSGHH